MDDAEARCNYMEAVKIMRDKRLGSRQDRALHAGAVLAKHLDRDAMAGHRVLQFIERFQTDEEVVERAALWRNNVGFSKYDADLCTDLAQREGGSLTDNQLRTCCRRAQKYSKQARPPARPPHAIPYISSPPALLGRRQR